MTIYVLSGFNNYYNRQVKRMETVSDYSSYVLHTQQNYNFVPNDNVNTQVVLGSNVNNYSGEGDYLLAVNEQNQIVSRWFIIESIRDRAGQFTLVLHRDLVADHLTELMDAPMYVEKATLEETDPFIFNSENLSLNQIKSGEYQIKDKSNCAWLVGYLSRTDLESGNGTELLDLGPYDLTVSNTLYNDEMTKSEWDSLVSEADGYAIADGYQFNFTVNNEWEGNRNVAYYLDTANLSKWKQVTVTTANASLFAEPSVIVGYHAIYGS